MASSSLRFAQDEVKLTCGMCDSSDLVNSYCRDCSAKVCDRCEKGHLRLLKKHTIVPVFEGLFENIHFKVKCEKHGERFRFYCKSCSVNICDDCLEFDHAQHKIEKVGMQAKKLKQNITQKIESQKTYLKTIQTPLKRIKQHHTDFEKQIKRKTDKVRVEIAKRKEMLDREGEKIIESLKQEQDKASEKLKIQYKELQGLDNKIKELIDSLESKLAIIPDEAVLDFVIENEKKLQPHMSDLTFELPSPPVFIPSSYIYEHGRVVLGCLKSVEVCRLNVEFGQNPGNAIDATQLVPTDPDIVPLPQKLNESVNPPPLLRRRLEIVDMLKPSGGAVLSISSTEDDMLWLGTKDCQMFFVDKNGTQKLKVIVPGQPHFTAVTGRGDVIICTWGHFLYKVTRQGQVSTFVDASPGEVYGIAATKQGDVFACVETDWVFKVRKFSSDGKFIQELDSSIFIPRNYQKYVHAVRDDVVCIQDGHPEYNDACQLVFVTASGQVISRVPRTAELNYSTKAIVWDGYDNMLIGSWWGYSIIVFSGKGVLKQIYEVKGFAGITALCLGKDGTLWIGRANGKVARAKYLQ